MSYHCPTCGAAIPGQHLGVALVVCAYCRTTSAVADGGLTAEGVGAAVAEVDSAFAVGRQGTLAGFPARSSFEVTGWARYLDDSGSWDEWALLFTDGTRQVVVEEEGTFSLFARHRIAAPLSLEGERPGSYLTLGEHRVLVRAVGQARLQGGHGGVTAPFAPAEVFRFVEGSVERELARISSDARQSIFMLGRPLERRDFDIEEP